MSTFKFKKKILATAAAAALGFGIMGNAHAGASAFSSLIVDNFEIFDNATGDQLGVGDFDAITASDTVTVSSSLNGGSAGPNSVTRSTTSADPSLGIADPAMACVGPDCGPIGQNDFSQQNAAGLPGSPLQFSRADARLVGSIISGTDQGLGGATAEQVAEVQLNQTSIGAADTSVTNSSEFVFTMDQARAVRFDFNATAVLDVLLNQEEVNASAARSFSISIFQDGNEIFSWVPSLGASGGTQNAAAFNLNTSLNIQSTGRTGPIVQSGFFSATTNLLAAGTYNLTIFSTTSANAEVLAVPEPATLGLLGAGLLGMGAVSRRRRNKAKA